MTAPAPVAWCPWPGCDREGPRLCPGHAHALDRLLDDVALDWLTLHVQLPPRAVGDHGPARRTGRPEPGHPAQWASDLARAIATSLDEHSEALRDHLGDLPPPPRGRAESRVTAHALRTLKRRTHLIHGWPGLPAMVGELADLHRAARRGLGLARAVTALPVPCPDCALLPLLREVHADGADDVRCPHCGTRITSAAYGLWTRILTADPPPSTPQEAL